MNYIDLYYSMSKQKVNFTVFTILYNVISPLTVVVNGLQKKDFQCMFSVPKYERPILSSLPLLPILSSWPSGVLAFSDG